MVRPRNDAELLEPPEGLEMLGDAEGEVVGRAVADGTNQEIARARGSSCRMVANWLVRSYRRLGVSSRRELAAFLADVPDGRTKCSETLSR